jgi:hypothetical protein
VVPVATEVGCLRRHDDHVADADADLLVAARAQVRLAGLVGLDAPHLDVVLGGACPWRVAHLGSRAHRRSAATTAKAAATKR